MKHLVIGLANSHSCPLKYLDSAIMVTHSKKSGHFQIRSPNSAINEYISPADSWGCWPVGACPDVDTETGTVGTETACTHGTGSWGAGRGGNMFIVMLDLFFRYSSPPINVSDSMNIYCGTPSPSHIT